ncbi:MAG: signal peptidase I [Vicinamibacterales bacterium]
MTSSWPGSRRWRPPRSTPRSSSRSASRSRVEGQSMAPTLADQDRLIVNKLAYRLADPQRGDIVMLYYPLNPDKSFVKRVIAEEGDTVRVVDGRTSTTCPFRQPCRSSTGATTTGPAGDPRGLLLRHGRSPEQQLRQPALGVRAEEVHHRKGAAPLVAGADRHHLLGFTTGSPGGRRRHAADAAGLPCPVERYRAVARVLIRVFFLNLAVAGAKIALGYSTGAVSILSDGFHSLTDTGSNVVALVGVRAARQPPDDDHPYGHRKFETMASVGILIFLVLVLVEVLSNALDRLRAGGVPDIQPLAFWVMGVTFVINVCVVIYERREGDRLQSEVLRSDAHHTRSDLLTSATVIAALIGVRLGYTWLDAVAALLVAGFIGLACWEIFQDTSRILGDRMVIDEQVIRDIVMRVPEVRSCHHIRTRGSSDFVFLDLHIRVDGQMPLHEAHRISHVVKDCVMAKLPQVRDVVIHAEPARGSNGIH